LFFLVAFVEDNDKLARCHLLIFFVSWSKDNDKPRSLLSTFWFRAYGITIEDQKMTTSHQAHCHLLVCFLHVLQHKTTRNSVHCRFFFFFHSLLERTMNQGLLVIFSFFFSNSYRR
jgi:hypothetical protein